MKCKHGIGCYCNTCQKAFLKAIDEAITMFPFTKEEIPMVDRLLRDAGHKKCFSTPAAEVVYKNMNGA